MNEHMKGIYKEVIKHEVFPAMGCTEPISIAYAASVASSGIDEPPVSLHFLVNQGTYKNGLAVTIPNTGGEKGNLIAGIIGCLVSKPERKMQILKEVTEAQLAMAKKLMSDRNFSISVNPDCHDFFVEVELKTENHSSICVIEGSHTNIVYHERDGKVILDKSTDPVEKKETAYKDILKNIKVSDIINIAGEIDAQDMDYLREGLKMNLAIADEGMKLNKMGYYLLDLMKRKMLLDDIFSSTKILTACAVDARMDGVSLPVMSSGGSGNQGIIASLVPYNVGKHFNVEEETILRSIALSHLLNSYVKVFTGELAPICGCAIAAGVGASSAIVYQQNGRDLRAITFAINNIISDIGGMLCDGAKSGCALKVVSSTDAALRAAYLGIHHYGISGMEGFVGLCAEDTIKNLGRITERGMAKMDETIVGIMLKKSKIRKG